MRIRSWFSDVIAWAKIPAEVELLSWRGDAPSHKRSLRDEKFDVKLRSMSEVREALRTFRFAAKYPFPVSSIEALPTQRGIPFFSLQAIMWTEARQGGSIRLEVTMNLRMPIRVRRLHLAARALCAMILEHEMDEWLMIDGKSEFNPHLALEREK